VTLPGSRIFSESDMLAERRYSEAVLASGRVDEFSVTTHAGVVYTLRYCGGHVCTALAADASPE
jgi:hypothetical protein